MANIKNLAAIAASTAAFITIAGGVGMQQASASPGFTLRYKVTVQQPPGKAPQPWCMSAIDGSGQKVYIASCDTPADALTNPENEVSYTVTAPAKQYYVNAEEASESLTVSCTIYKNDQIVATDAHKGSCMASYYPST